MPEKPAPDQAARRPAALVTGATGYVGSRIARRLADDGWSVHALVRPTSRMGLLSPQDKGISVHEFDGTSSGMARIFALARPDVVFHLAAMSLPQRHRPEDVEPLLASNVLFPTQLLEGMASAGVTRIINTGTFSQHFENSAYSPSSLYAATKQAFESILLFYQQARIVEGITLVLFETYGPADPRNKIFAQLRRAASTGVPLPMSPGGQRVDMVYIDDVVDAYVACAARLLGGRVQGPERFAVRTGYRLSIREVVSTYSRVTGAEVPVVWGGRPYREREIMEPWTGGEPVPGWAPKVGIEEGISLMEGFPEPFGEPRTGSGN